MSIDNLEKYTRTRHYKLIMKNMFFPTFLTINDYEKKAQQSHYIHTLNKITS